MSELTNIPVPLNLSILECKYNGKVVNFEEGEALNLSILECKLEKVNTVAILLKNFKSIHTGM